MDGPVLQAHAGLGDVLPPLTAARALGTWVVEPLPLAVVVVVGGLYGCGVARLRARGDSWSRWRTLCFVGPGLGSVVAATSSALAAYDTVLVWVHMVQHMVLTTAAPVFLALGAPLTLALRTLPPGGRRALLAVVHSRVAAVLTFPVVAGILYVVAPFVLYFTGLYELSLRNPVVHELNHLHFVLVGCLWFWVILGLDPLPRRPAYPLRMLAVFATLPFHAILGVTIMGASTLLAGDWYRELGRSWGPTLAEDQRIAGGLLWAAGDVVGVLVLAVLFVQWVGESEREAAREDRRLDRLEARAAAERAAGAASDPPVASPP